MKNLKRCLSAVIILMITIAMIPMIVSADIAERTGHKFEEVAVDARGNIYKLVFSVKTSTTIRAMLTVLSFDNTVIQPVDWKNDYAAADTATAPESPFDTVTANCTILEPAWLTNADRTAFNITILRDSESVKSNSNYIPIFEFYYRRIAGKTTVDYDSATFIIENGATVGGFVQQFFPEHDGYGIAITDAGNETFYCGAEKTAVYPTKIGEVTRAYPNATVKNKELPTLTEDITSDTAQFINNNDNEKSGVSATGQTGSTLLLSSQRGNSNELTAICTVSNITSFDGKTFKIAYNPAHIDLVDFAAQTAASTVDVGFVADTDLRILSHDTTAGILTFKVNKTIGAGKMWSGAVTVLKFAEKIPGSAISFEIINGAIGSNKILTGKAISLAYDTRPATVTLTSAALGSSPVTAYTATDYVYGFNNVPTGNYTMKISKISYLSYTKQNLTVGEIDILYKDITLIPGDIDGNGQVNYNDLTILLTNYNLIGNAIINPAADIDGNGHVNYNAQTALLSGYNKMAVVE